MMTANLKLSTHAKLQYGIRTGTPPLQCSENLYADLSTAHEISRVEAVADFPITRIEAGDRYLRWTSPHIREDMLAIVRENTVVTVLTRVVYSSLAQKKPYKNYAIKNGQIVTLDPWYLRKGGLNHR